MRNIEINPGGPVFKRTGQFMAYAADLAVTGRSVGVLNKALTNLQTAAASTGFVINTTKTKYMRIEETIGAANIDMKLNGQICERVDNFKYLGALVTSQNEKETDIKDKIAAVDLCFRAFNKMLGTRYLSKNMKIRTYKTIIRPVSETWTIPGKMASNLMTWERKNLRKMHGPKREQWAWRIRRKLEIQNMHKSSDIMTEIKVRRLEWLGHVVTMGDTRLPKIIFKAKPEDRPRMRWLDDIEADIKALGVKRWTIKA